MSQQEFDEGVVLLESGRAEEARLHFQKMLEAHPNNGYIWGALGLACGNLGRTNESIDAYRKAVILDPTTHIWREQLALTILPNGRFEEAASLVEGVDSIGALFVEASASEFRGDFSATIALIEQIQERCRNPPAIEVGRALPPEYFAERSRYLLGRVHLKLGRYTESYQTLLGCQGSPDTHYDLGTVLEKLGDHEKAWQHWTFANEISRHAFDSARFREKRDLELAAKFSHRGADPGGDLIFIVGIPRSGTSLVEQVLSRHPDVTPMGERTALTPIVNEMGGAGWPDVGSEYWDLFTGMYREGLPEGVSGKTRYTDKMPENWRHTKMIRAMFPGCKIVHVVRNPEDALVSCYSQNFQNSALAWSCSLEGMRTYYQEWARTPIEEITVKYEDLVSSPDKVIPALLENLGLSPCEDCLYPDQSDRFMATASYEQVRKPINARSVGRGKPFIKWLAPVFE